jgi:formate/nitrite transporter FocA (FNT family)
MKSPRELTPAEVSASRVRPSEAASVHETIRINGERELGRDAGALFWSALAAGLSMSFSMVASGVLQSRLPEGDVAFLIRSFGYTVGFLMVILARQQLFTENTVTAVLPVMSKPSRGNVLRLLRLWGVVLTGNLLGVAFAAYMFLHLPLFSGETGGAFIALGHHIMENSAGQMFGKGIVAGWLIAIMVWLIPPADQAKIWVILLMTYLIAVAGLTHIIAGATEVLYLVFAGETGWWDFLFRFALPTLAGNIFGGTFMFALISHAQVRSDLRR